MVRFVWWMALAVVGALLYKPVVAVLTEVVGVLLAVVVTALFLAAMAAVALFVLYRARST
jgi:hypothetical protein